jgi:tetratricopeptide (TPR) repeat protein
MSEPRPDERARFLQNMRDALQKAERSSKPALVFVRVVEGGLQVSAAGAIEDAFKRIAWTRLDLATAESWARLRAAAGEQRRGGLATGWLMHRLPAAPDGAVERGAIQELQRLAPYFLRKGTVAVFVLVPTEAQSLMDRAPELWTARAGYLSWPQRSQPLSGRNPYGVDEAEEEEIEARIRTGREARARGDESALEGAAPNDLLVAAATLFQSGFLDHAGGHAVQALTHFEVRHDHRGAGEAQHVLAMIAEKRGDASSALGWYEKALESYRRVHETDLEQSIVQQRMGNMQYARGQYELALTHLRRALELDEKRDDKPRMAAGFRHIALILERLDQVAMADTFLRRSLELEQRQENRAGLARCYVHLGRVGYRLGRFVEANDHLMQSLKICEDLDDRSGLSAVLHELGNADLEQGLQPEAIKWYRKAIEVDEARGDRRALARIHAQLGHAYAEAGRPTDALHHLLVAHSAAGVLGVTVAKQVLSRIGQLRETLDKDAYQKVVDGVELAIEDQAARIAAALERQKEEKRAPEAPVGLEV